ncbi:hypothetical protein NKG94_18695 [Micromonospora sp. M12]
MGIDRFMSEAGRSPTSRATRWPPCWWEPGPGVRPGPGGRVLRGDDPFDEATMLDEHDDADEEADAPRSDEQTTARTGASA